MSEKTKCAAYQTENTASKIKAGIYTTNYTFDVCGNMIQEGVSRHYEYDAGDVLRAYYVDAGAGTEPSTFTRCRQTVPEPVAPRRPEPSRRVLNLSK